MGVLPSLSHPLPPNVTKAMTSRASLIVPLNLEFLLAYQPP